MGLDNMGGLGGSLYDCGVSLPTATRKVGKEGGGVGSGEASSREGTSGVLKDKTFSPLPLGIP